MIGLINTDPIKVTIAGRGRLKAVAAAPPQWRQSPARSSDHTGDSLCMLHIHVYDKV